MSEGSAFSTISKAILMIIVLIVGILVFSGLAGEGGSKLNNLLSGIPGIPEKKPVLETGIKLENAVCQFSYECSFGLACWKGMSGGHGLGICVKYIGDPQIINIDGKHVTKSGVCYTSESGFVRDWVNTGMVPRDSWISVTEGLYIMEAGNDKIYLNSQEPVIAPRIYSPDLQFPIAPDVGWTNLEKGARIQLSGTDTYVVQISKEGLQFIGRNSLVLYGGFYDSDTVTGCKDNKGYNSVVLYKILDTCSNDYPRCSYTPPQTTVT